MEYFLSNKYKNIASVKYVTSGNVEEYLEDIQQPEFTNISLSESYTSQISSWCSEIHSTGDVQDTGAAVPPNVSIQNAGTDHSGIDLPQSCTEDRSGKTMENNESFQGCHLPMKKEFKASSLSGSSQSLSSSTQTLFASPSPNADVQSSSCFKGLKLTKGGFPSRRGSLTRDYPPSDDSMMYRKSILRNEFKLSQSLQDVTSIPSNTLQAQTHRKSLNSGSCYSKNKSKDSGFVPSDSQQSLNSGVGHNYDHVQSKVKLYIQNIKDAEAQSRKERSSVMRWISNANPKQKPDHLSTEEITDLRSIVENLKYEVAEKDRLLFQLQGNYDSLLQKYSEAETRIDRLRFACVGQFQSQERKLSTEIVSGKPPNLLIENQIVPGSNYGSHHRHILPHKDNEGQSHELSSDKDIFESGMGDTMSSMTSSGLSNSKKSKGAVVIRAPLRPVSRLYCTSMRIGCVLSPLPDNVSRQTNCKSSSTEKQACHLQSTTDSRESMSGALSEVVHLLPKDDTLAKVERWQKLNGKLSCPVVINGSNQLSTPLLENFNSIQNDKDFKSSALGVSDSNSGLTESFESGIPFPCQICEGKCSNCGCTMYFDRTAKQGGAPRVFSSIEISQCLKYLQRTLLCETHISKCQPSACRQHKSEQIDSTTLTSMHQEISCTNRGEEDHVVPKSPFSETSLENSLQNVKASDLKNLTPLFILLKKISSTVCHHCNVATTNKSNQTEDGFEDASLLQCLNEVDEFVNQLWKKNKTCIDKSC